MRSIRFLLVVCTVFLVSGCASERVQYHLSSSFDGYDQPSELIDHLSGIRTGNPFGQPLAAVFFDPGCPVCSHYYQTVRHEAPSAPVLWVPIGTHGESLEITSEGGIKLLPATENLAICTMANPKHLALGTILASRGEAAKCSSPSRLSIEVVHENEHVFSDFYHFTGIPTTVVHEESPVDDVVVIGSDQIGAEIIKGAMGDSFDEKKQRRWILVHPKTHEPVNLSVIGVKTFASPSAACNFIAPRIQGRIVHGYLSHKTSHVCYLPGWTVPVAYVVTIFIN